MTLEHTSAITASSSRTSASVDGKGKLLARHSWSRRSTKWSADDSSRNSRCNGRCAGRIFCCRRGRGSSTRIWTTYSAVGIQNSGHKHQRRSQSARRLDPRLFGALQVPARKYYADIDAIIARELGKRKLERIPVRDAKPDRTPGDQKAWSRKTSSRAERIRLARRKLR